jgi:ribosomal protein S18 acetylase RimI-like enzyme
VLQEIRNDPGLQFQLMARDPKPNTIDDVRAWLERPAKDAFFVVDSDGECIGFVQALTEDYPKVGICLHPSAQCKGHGKAAMILLEQHLTAGGAQKIMLEVLSDNPALGLYRKLGYRTVGTMERHYKGRAVTIMEKLFP